MRKLLPFTFFIFIASIGFCQTETTIEEIINNPGKFNHERVVIEGFVTRYVLGSATTSSYYELQGEYGGRIRVNTGEPAPDIWAKYSVMGTVTIHLQDPLLIEINKTNIGKPKMTFLETVKENWLLSIIVVCLIIIVILIIYYLLPRKSSLTKADNEKKQSGKLKDDSQEKDKELNTVKFETKRPKTVKAIPGQLEIMVGSDKGQSLRLVGTPTSEGAVATIGRDYEGWEKDLSGDKKYTHIRIKDDSRTLSRMQAEIVYKNKKVYLKNIASVNPSMVNGRDVSVNESVVLENGSVIKAGFMEFLYKD